MEASPRQGSPRRPEKVRPPAVAEARPSPCRDRMPVIMGACQPRSAIARSSRTSVPTFTSVPSFSARCTVLRPTPDT